MIGERYHLDKKEKMLKDLETGEIYTEKEEIAEWIESRKHEKEDEKNLVKQLRQTFNLPTALELYQQRWKDDSWFIKVYRTEMREYKKQTQLSSSAGLLLFYLIEYIEYRTNRIVDKKGKALTNDDMADLVGLNKKTIVKSLSELESKMFIKRIGAGRSRQIYFNPYLASGGNQLDKTIIEKFEDYEPITAY